MKTVSCARQLLAVVGFGALLTGPAGAATIVTTWAYTLDSTWLTATFFNDNLAQRGITPSELSWGATAPADRSSLTIGGSPISGSVDTLIGGGLPVPPFVGVGNSITHNNQAINVGTPTLNLATLQATLTVDSSVPAGGGPLTLPPLSFNISFSETPNLAPCAVTTSPTPCNDIFVLAGGLLNQSFMYNTGDGPVQYFVNIFPTTGGVLGMLPNDVCAAASAPNGCLGFTTPENQATTIAFGFTISTQPLQVPEPGTLALLGAALLGGGFWRTRRKA